MTRKIAILILTIMYILSGCPDSLLERGLRSALIYPLFHGNVFHLIVNCLAMWTILHPARQHKGRMLIVAYAVSCIVYPLSVRPIVGVSNMLFAMSGMCTPPIDRKWLTRSQTITFLVVMLALIPFPMFSAVTHIASFILGVGFAYLFRFTDRIAYEADRAGR